MIENQILLDTAQKASIAQNSTQAIFARDEFRMYMYKVVQCSKRYGHDWTDCPFAHPGEKAQRRCPRKYSYLGIACPDVKRASDCPRGEKCCFAHNVFEYWLHPTRYRTQLCSYGPNCRRSVCFFAHSIQELRVPTCEKVINPSGITQETAQQLSTGDAALALQYAQATGLHDLTSQLLRSTNLTSQLAMVQASQFDPFGNSSRQMPAPTPLMPNNDVALLATLQALQAQATAQAQASLWQTQAQLQQHHSPTSNAMALAAALAAAQQQPPCKPPHLQLPEQLMASLMAPTTPSHSASHSHSAATSLSPGSATDSSSQLSQVDVQAYLLAQQLSALQHQQQAQLMQQQAQLPSSSSSDLSAQLSALINKLDSTRLGGVDASALLDIQQQHQQHQLLAAVSAGMPAANSSNSGSSSPILDIPTPPLYEGGKVQQAAGI